MTAAYGSSGSFVSRLRSNILEIAHIQLEEVIFIQEQHQLMYSFTNLI